MTILELIDAAASRLDAAHLSFGHGTSNAFDEAAWLVLWKLGLPLDTQLAEPGDAPAIVSARQQAQVRELIEERIRSRRPAAYITGEAWLQGLAFHVDQRAIVPRSLIAEPLASGALDCWLPTQASRLLDLCTGGGSLAILAALAWPELAVDASDLSADALEVAAINVERHGMQSRIRLWRGNGMEAVPGPYDLILCNPPYVNAESMQTLPAEYLAEPRLALDGGSDGMDFIRRLLRDAPAKMSSDAALVLEIGNERHHFDAAFGALEAVWIDTSAGSDQVCVLTRGVLAAQWKKDALSASALKQA
ncbi:MAG: 50S ribosomal protein L3 N(5)-glutamine methyltransferase [Burkholderiaceae bacterium]